MLDSHRLPSPREDRIAAWVSQEELGKSLGLEPIEVGIKLVEYGLKDGETGKPTGAALEHHLAREKKLLLFPLGYEWNLTLVRSFFENDPSLQIRRERYASMVVEISKKMEELVLSGRSREAKEMEVNFWRSIPQGIRPELMKFAEAYMGDLIYQRKQRALLLIQKRAREFGELLEVMPFRKSGLDNLLREINRACTQDGILTLASDVGLGKSVAVRKVGDRIRIGENPQEFADFIGYLRLATSLLFCETAPGREKRMGFYIGWVGENFYYKEVPEGELLAPPIGGGEEGKLEENPDGGSPPCNPPSNE